MLTIDLYIIHGKKYYTRPYELVEGCDELLRDNYSPKRAPLDVGEEYEVKIEDLGKEGDGLTHIEGFVVFVPGTEVGDEVKVRITSVRRSFAFAEKIE